MEKTAEQKQTAIYGYPIRIMLEEKPSYITDLDFAFSLLSDAQALIKVAPEQSRQMINKAKFFINQSRGVNVEVK